MKDKLNITIRIADTAPLHLSIEREEEETIRNAEFKVNELWRAWSGRFKNRTSHEIMAMVAFRFAQLYFTLNTQAASINDRLGDFEEELDRLLLKID